MISGALHVRGYWALVALCLSVSCAAFARQADGTLGLIRTPNNGIPAIVTPGTSFEVVLKSNGTVRLVGGNGPLDLVTEWTALPGGMAKGRCTVPADVSPGIYAVEATAGDQTDKNEHSVFVVESFPDTYVAAQLTDVHIGREDCKRDPAEVLGELFTNLNGSGAAFVLVTGDLTHTGDIPQFQAFLKALELSTLPVFVCPGNHDRTGVNYGGFFGPACYMFKHGSDGYLSFDTKDFIAADDLGAQDGELEVFRRAIKASRWSIGFAHRYEPEMGMRCQLALFVDDPLDVLLMGHLHRSNDEGEKNVLWGTTAFVVTPAAMDGFARLFDISPKGVKPRPAQRIVNTD